ncbi:MAG: AraC family transcriptional regulator [Candidatus Merdivicinus sp.]|jgi:AraC-like DNA-binding protein
MDQRDPLILEACYRNTNTCFGRHFHHAYEFMYITGGSIRVRIGGQEYIANPNHMILFSNLEEHEGFLLQAPFQRYYATISAEQADRLVNEPVLISLLKNRPVNFCHVIDVTGMEAEFSEFFDIVITERETPGTFSNDLCALSLKKLLISLYRKKREYFPKLDNPMHAVIYNIQKYLDENYMQPIRIEELARNFYVDLYYLSHCFKEQTGYSPKQYLMKVRVSRARELLIHSKLPISEVAFRCGFGDVNNFIRSFKSDTGSTPNQYRKLADRKIDVF